jgi:type II secretory pathway pseudopilin PulG
MTAMKKTTLVAMAIILALATAATAATAFAGSKKKRLQGNQAVAESVQTTSQAMLNAKIKYRLRLYVPTPGNTSAPK